MASLPTTRQVAALTQKRTRPAIGGGADTGDFTANTVPTAVDVEAFIARSARSVALVIGSLDRFTAGSEMQQAINDVIALGAAALIERSYTPDRTNSADGMYASLDAQYQRELKALTQAVIEFDRDGTPNAGNGLMPAGPGLVPDRAPYGAVYWWEDPMRIAWW